MAVSGQLWSGILYTSRSGLWVTPEISSSIGLLGHADSYTVLAEVLDPYGVPVAQQEMTLNK